LRLSEGMQKKFGAVRMARGDDIRGVLPPGLGADLLCRVSRYQNRWRAWRGIDVRGSHLGFRWCADFIAVRGVRAL